MTCRASHQHHVNFPLAWRQTEMDIITQPNRKCQTAYNSSVCVGGLLFIQEKNLLFEGAI